MNAPLTMKDYETDQEVRWCPGCGDYAILKTLHKFMPTLGLPRENSVFISGIGCSSRFPYYMNTYGFHTIHGRAPSLATGVKLANPELDVWVVTGDGDGLSIGGNHMLHVLRRNVDLQILLFNNEIYGLTKGQYSPTSKVGTRSPSTPDGSVDRPLDPCSFALGAGAQFVARSIDTEMKHLTEMLGGDQSAINLAATPPAAIMMVGLQGSGKTTSTAKVAIHLRDQFRKKALMASLDVRRPAAQQQLQGLGTDAGIATLPIVPFETPEIIAKRAMDTARKEGYDVVLLDTAGRLHIDDELMDEAASVHNITKPVETLFVADAMTGQDAVHAAEAFHQKLHVTGIVLTRIDGDARGGAALSIRAVTGCPIKLLGTGEKLDALEVFHPERIASRILGMGDVVSLVEKASEVVEEEEAERLRKKRVAEYEFQIQNEKIRKLMDQEIT